MKQLVITSKRSFSVNEEPASEIGTDSDEIKVKIARAIISSSDLSNFNSGEKIIPCRSAIAYISESNNDSHKKGQKLFLSPYFMADGKKLTRGVDVSGCLQDFCIVKEEAIRILPEGLTEDRAMFIEDVALAMTAYGNLGVEKTEYLLIFGASALGAILAQIAIYYQAIPIIIDDNDSLLKKAQDCGVYYTINSKKESISEMVREITGGALATHAAWDCDVSSEPGRLKFAHIRRGSNLALIGFDITGNRLVADVAPLLKYELNLVGINNGRKEIDSAINMLVNEAVMVDEYIGESATFDKAQKFFEKLLEKAGGFKHYISI